MASDYPPTRHILRHLRLSHTTDENGKISGSMPILPDMLDADGWLRLGIMATLVDSVAGHHGVMQVQPDWVATLQLGTVLTAQPSGDEVRAYCEPMRIGRNNVVTETRIEDQNGLIGHSICTFARLPARPGFELPKIATRNRVVDYAEENEESPRPNFDDYLQMNINPDKPIIELPHHSRIYNSFGSIQGGAVVVLVERMARHIAELEDERNARCITADVHYLAQAKDGPFKVEGEVLRKDAMGVTSQVTIRDLGSGRLLDVATATAVYL